MRWDAWTSKVYIMSSPEGDPYEPRSTELLMISDQYGKPSSACLVTSL